MLTLKGTIQQYENRIIKIRKKASMQILEIEKEVNRLEKRLNLNIEKVDKETTIIRQSKANDLAI
jgi:hypothetical protein